MDKYTLPVCSTVYSDRTEKAKVTDVSLPEYYPNIVKIIKTDGVVSSLYTDQRDNAVTLSGTANIRVTYVSDQNGYIKTASFPLDFEHTFDARFVRDENALYVYEPYAYVLAASSKPKGPRSIEIKSNIALGVTVCDDRDTELLSEDGAQDVELHPNTVRTAKRLRLPTASENLHDDITLESGMPAASEIADSYAMLRLDDIKTENGALVYNGTAAVKCTYRAENGDPSAEAEYVYLTKDVPIGGEVVDERVEEGMAAVGRLVLTDIECGCSFDPYGESRIINVNIGCDFVGEVFSESETEYFDDGYCPSYECDFKHSTYNCERIAGKIAETAYISEKLHSDRSSLVQISDTYMQLNVGGAEVADGVLFVNGKASVWISGLDERGEPDCLNTSFNLHTPLEGVRDVSPDKKYVVSADLSSCDASIQNGEIVIEAEADIRGVALEKFRIDAISSADVNYESPKEKCKSEYIIYYPDRNESLWDIAKKYEMPEDDIKSANGLKPESETTGDKKTVIIPCR